VYYEGDSTIREGMPLCYNYDTTDNWMGVSSIDFTSTASTITESGTTAEGNQNEGKFIRVEDPSTSNLAWFAGVVAGADHDGETGPMALDIYEANGAIVPVRCNIDTTAAGRSILAIDDAATSLTSLGTSSNYTSRAVAIAAEDVVGTSGTPVLCLAKLDPNIFICQDLSGTYPNNSLIIAPAGTSYSALNRINVTNAATAGEMGVFEIKSDNTGGVNSPWGLCAYFRARHYGTMTDRACAFGVAMAMESGGSTTADLLSALRVKLVANTGSTISTAANANVLNLEADIDVTAPARCSYIHCSAIGANTPNYFLDVLDAGDLGDHAAEGSLSSTSAGDRMIPVRFGSSTFYLVAYADDDVS